MSFETRDAGVETPEPLRAQSGEGTAAARAAPPKGRTPSHAPLLVWQPVYLT